MHAGAQAQLSLGSEDGSSSYYVPAPTPPPATPISTPEQLLPAPTEDPLVPYTMMEDLSQQTSVLQMLFPTPSVTTALPNSGDGSGDNSPLEPQETPTLQPTPVPPQPNVIIRLRLNFHGLSDEEQMQLIQNLSDAVKDILQLSIAPTIFQQSEDIIDMFIVTTSSMFEPVANGDLTVIKAELNSIVGSFARVTVSLWCTMISISISVSLMILAVFLLFFSS